MKLVLVLLLAALAWSLDKEFTFTNLAPKKRHCEGEIIQAEQLMVGSMKTPPNAELSFQLFDSVDSQMINSESKDPVFSFVTQNVGIYSVCVVNRGHSPVSGTFSLKVGDAAKQQASLNPH